MIRASSIKGHVFLIRHDAVDRHETLDTLGPERGDRLDP
jgi:hypothetical protein